MAISVSVIIPVRNSEDTIKSCLEAVFESDYENFEVIVVDDYSTDCSLEIISNYPCKVIRLAKHFGASKARNVGASHSNSDILFFTDADCLLNSDTLTIAVDTLSSIDPSIVLGGTYSPQSADNNFFSIFQSVFINYSESKNASSPDYVATHAMIIRTGEFYKHGCFAEDFLPILEDVEFSHRIRRHGFQLVLNPAIQVRHIFGYSLGKSMLNAFRKSMYWTAYSINNRDLLKDSGTASLGLKLNTLIWFINILVLLSSIWTGEVIVLLVLVFTLILNTTWNRRLLLAFYKAGGSWFFTTATAYYMLVYPVAVGLGGVTSLLKYQKFKKMIRPPD